MKFYVKSIAHYEKLKNGLLERFLRELKLKDVLILDFPNLNALDSDAVGFDIVALINHKSKMTVHIERKSNEYFIKEVG